MVIALIPALTELINECKQDCCLYLRDMFLCEHKRKQAAIEIPVLSDRTPYLLVAGLL